MIKINHYYMNDTTVIHCRKHRNDEHQKVKKKKLPQIHNPKMPKKQF